MKFKALVKSGIGLGRKIGFPTLNLKPPKSLGLEGSVYAVKVKIGHDVYWGALFNGKRSNLKEMDEKKGEITCEVHLLDFFENKSVKEVTIEVKKKIRDEMNFETINDLQKMIEQDLMKIKLINEEG